MKELSIEEKAKAYDEAIERAKGVIEQNPLMEYLKKGIEYILPELRESEDEKIRKAIIEHFAGSHSSMYPYKGFTKEQILAWLEKQGEQKSADKTEPKFKAGKWYLCVKDFWGKGVRFDKGHAYYCGLNGCLQEFDSGAHIAIDEKLYDYFNLWTIQDAKDGDVLAAHECLVLFKEIDGLNIKCYCTYHFINNESFFVDTLQNKTAFVPATKEQRDTLMKAMADAGYTFDFEKKELKKIAVPIFNIGDSIIKKHNSDINDFGSFTITDITGGKYWYNDRIICDISEQYEWELYEPVRQNPAWNEEDETYLGLVITAIKLYYTDDKGEENPWREELLRWFKSLKERFGCEVNCTTTWKPSALQIEALESATENCAYSEYQDCLRKLIEQLKKLKG